MKKSLTKLPYLRLLSAIGLSEEPFTSQQIMNKMIEERYIDFSSKKDIFRMLKKLVPESHICDKHTYLCNWNEILSNNNDEQYLLLRRIKDIFELDWEIEERKSKDTIKNHHIDNNNSQISCVISKDNDSTLLTIRYGEHSIIAIPIPGIPNSKSSLLLLSIKDRSISVVKEKKIITKIINGTSRIYLEKQNINRTRFLDITLSKKIKNKHPLLNKYWEYIEGKDVHTLFTYEDIPAKIVKEIIEDDTCKTLIYSTTFWKYKLNFRGFLLYLLAETISERKNNRRLKQIISRKSIMKIAPFLISHEFLDILGFDTVKALSEITVEYQYHLDYDDSQTPYTSNYNDEFLFYNVLESYFAKVERYFCLYDDFQFAINIKKLGSKKHAYIRHKVLDHILFMMDLLRRGREKKITQFDDRYRSYNEKYEKYDPESFITV